MPLQISRLDTQMPSSWDGTSERDGDPSLDALTEGRYVVGDDPVNYFTQQRIGGDLANRDLRVEKSLQGVLDYLATRTGLLYSVPPIRILAGDSIRVARIKIPAATPKWYIVGSEIGNLTDALASFTLTVVNTAGPTTVYTQSALGNVYTAAATTDRGTLLTTGLTYDVLLTNTSAGNKVGFGSVTLQPRLYS